ncbi:MAG: hypothetical protein M3R26_02410 [Actinomycetota bacterium]|nr:hypothetical protein [Actinomycetota bacterium]
MLVRAAKVVIGTALVVGALPLVLYGVFAILYTGESGSRSNTYITLNGHEIDAHLAGGVVLSIAGLAFVLAFVLLKSARTAARSSGA